MYNLTPLQESQDLVTVAVFINDATQQVFTSFLMIGIFFILLLALKRYSFENALLAASWVCMLLSLFLTYAGLLNFLFPLAFLLMAAFTGLYVYQSRN